MAMFNNQMVTEKSPETARDHRDTYQILYILWDVSLTIYIQYTEHFVYLAVGADPIKKMFMEDPHRKYPCPI